MRTTFAFAALLLVSGCASSRVAREAAPTASSPTGTMEITPLDTAKECEKRQDGFGLDRQNMDTEGLPVTDEQIGKVLDWRAQLPAQARVALLEARAVREYCTCGSWGSPDVQVEGTQWTVRPTVAEEVDAMREELVKSARVGAVATVPAMFLPLHADLARCRYASARANADVILLYAKATRVLRYHNRLANFYPLIVGLALPGEETVVVSRVEGALVDVRTGRVFAVSQASARRSDSSTVFTSSDAARSELLEATERDAVCALARGIRSDLELTPVTAPKTAHE